MVNKNKSCGKSQLSHYSPLSLFSIDDCPVKVPAAGNRNGTSLNNAGENGNYWSSTPNEDNDNNAYNLNFNANGNNWNNWNNRYNGHSVRPVQEFTRGLENTGKDLFFNITKEQLLLDLYRAYKDAGKHKRGRTCLLEYEYNLEDNLIKLRDELWNRTYKPLPSTCFIIHDPKMREVFAAAFKDRIVHHLFYNYTYELFVRTFIADSYSCIKGRGTHYGIERLKHHIRSVSAGWTKPCYVLKIDIRGYFMHIDRNILLRLCRESLTKMKNHKSDVNGKKWCDVIDYEFTDYLLQIIITTEPTGDCVILGKKEDWVGLPPDKSIFMSDKDCGLPIGNLSSQLFSNVYMNTFDQFMKRKLGCKHYGRYVDDAFVVSDNRDFLKALIPQIRNFLNENLKLSINEDKLQIENADYGVEFLGAYIKPFRTYISNKTLRRIRRNLSVIKTNDIGLYASVNSFLGVFSHYNSYRIRRVLFGNNKSLIESGVFSKDWLLYK